MRFIKLTNAAHEAPVFIRLDDIVAFGVMNESEKTCFVRLRHSKAVFDVLENVHQIFTAMKEAGSHEVQRSGCLGPSGYYSPAEKEAK